MDRYFIDNRIADADSIDPDSDDAFVLWRIVDLDDGQQAERTLFDFSRGFDHRARNLVHRRIVVQPNFDGLIANVVLRSGRCREADLAEYSAVHDGLTAKSLYLQRVKRRRQVLEVEYAATDAPRLP
ncbi:MAG: hypothetical protein ACREP7_01780 [Lysobacter sp.]